MTDPPKRPWRRKRRWVAAALLLLLAAGASVRHERREYRDGAGDVTAVRSAVLPPWRRLPPGPDDRSGSVTSEGSLGYGLVTWRHRGTREVSPVTGTALPRPPSGTAPPAGAEP